MAWYRAQMHGIGSLPELYLSEEGGQMKVCMWWYLLYQTQHVTSCWDTPGSCIFFMSEFSSAMMPFTEDSKHVFSHQIILLLFRPKLFCCFTVRAGRNDSSLNLTLKWKKSSGKCLAWKSREVTGSRTHDAYCRGKSLSMVLVHFNREESYFFLLDNAQYPKSSSLLLPCSSGSSVPHWPSISGGREIKGFWHGSRNVRSNSALSLLCEAFLQWSTG